MGVTIEADREVEILIASLQRELKLIEYSMERTKKKILEFEKRFGMPSEKFYEKFEKGETDDSQETMLWASEIESLKFLDEDRQAILRMLEMCRG